MADLKSVPTKNTRPEGEKQAFTLGLEHLKPATRGWVEQICRDYELESQHLRILQLAAESWDLYINARDAIATHGTVSVSKKTGVVRMRPEVKIAETSRLAFLRCLRELNLDVAPPEAPRPQPLRYPR